MTSPRILLKAWNLHARKRMGQNFLCNPATADLIVKRARVKHTDAVVEIGSGLGALTIPAAKAAGRIWAVEPDAGLIPLLKAELAIHGIDNVTIIKDGILQMDLAVLAAKAGCRLLVLGNLPYNISSQIIVYLINCRKVVRKAVLMLQKELMERIVSPPGSRTYGRLSVMLQYCADLSPLADVPSQCFFPQPKVDSKVLAIRFREPEAALAQDESHLFQVIKAAFGQRRKTLKNALSGSELQYSATRIVTALQGAKIDPSRRAETLSVAEFVRLSNVLGPSPVMTE